MKNEELSPYDSFFSKLRIINPLAKGYNDFENLTTSGLSTEQAVCKLRLERYLQQVIKKTTPICGASGWAKEWYLLQTFSCGTGPKRLFQLWKQCRKGLNFTSKRGLICWSWVELYLIWQTFACKFQQIQSFTFLLKARRGQRLVGEDFWRFAWSSLHCLYTQNCDWRNFYPQINKYVQIKCRHRHKPTPSLCDVSTNVHWIVYKMELWYWILKKHSSTEQNTFFWKKNCPLLLSTNSSGM